MAVAVPHERRFVRRSQIAARCDKKGTATHRGIDNPEPANAIRWSILDQRPKRAADQVIGSPGRSAEKPNYA